MRITTCFRSEMVPVKPAGSGLAAADRRTVLAAAVPPGRPMVAAAAAPSPVACRKRRRLTPGTIGRPGCHDDPVSPCSRSGEFAILIHPLGAGLWVLPVALVLPPAHLSVQVDM